MVLDISTFVALWQFCSFCALNWDFYRVTDTRLLLVLSNTPMISKYLTLIAICSRANGIFTRLHLFQDKVGLAIPKQLLRNITQFLLKKPKTYYTKSIRTHTKVKNPLKSEPSKWNDGTSFQKKCFNNFIPAEGFSSCKTCKILYNDQFYLNVLL